MNYFTWCKGTRAGAHGQTPCTHRANGDDGLCDQHREMEEKKGRRT